MRRRPTDPGTFEKLEPDDHRRIEVENITFSVVTDCGGDADTHKPKTCQQPHCGEYRASRGNEHAYGVTPLIALRRLPAAA